MAFCLFKDGEYENRTNLEEPRKGTISELEGRLAFIDYIDFQNNLTEKKHPTPKYEYRAQKGKFAFRKQLNSREAVYSRFLHYKWFYGNKHPTILTEGKTDNVYLKSALSSLQKNYPDLVIPKTPLGQYEPKLSFPNLNKKTMYLLDLGNGATSFIRFVSRFVEEQKYFHGKKAESPVILILDNDDGPRTLLNHLATKVVTCPNKLEDIKKSNFLHIFENLYLILTPLKPGGKDSEMEDLFDSATLKTVLNGKTLSLADNFDESKHYGKHVFSTNVVRSNKAKVNFDNFKFIFDQIENIKAHFAKL